MAKSTEKRSIIFANAKVTQGRMKSDRLQGLDVRGDNVSFGDDDINFDLQLEKFGVDMEDGGVEACANLSCISGMD